MMPRPALLLSLALLFGCAEVSLLDSGEAAAQTAEPTPEPTPDPEAEARARLATRIEQLRELATASAPQALPLPEGSLSPALLVALRRGDCEAALVLLEQRQAELTGRDPAGALARERCGDPSQLEAHLLSSDAPELAEPLERALQPYIRLSHARAQVQRASPDDPAFMDYSYPVLELLEGVELPGRAGEEVKLRLGQALIGQHRSLEAREGLRSLLDGEFGAEARWWLAWGAETRDAIDPAIGTYRAVWVRHPDSPWAERAVERLRERGQTVPDYSTRSGREVVLQRARRLIEMGRAADAWELYQEVDRNREGDSDAWRYEYAVAAYKARDYEVSAPLLATPAMQQQGGAEAIYQLAVSLTRTADYPGAQEAYRSLAERYPDHARADLASYKPGYLLYDSHQLEDAVVELRAHLERRPSSRHASEARWFIAWSLYKLDRFDEAQAAFSELLRRHPGSSLAAGSRYWLARIEGKLGNPDAERAALEQLLETTPNTGYGWFAAGTLNRSFEGLGTLEVPALAELLPGEAAVADAALLLGAGQPEWAADQLRSLEGAASRAGRRATLTLAHAMGETGAYKEGRTLAGRCPKPWEASASDLLALGACYPRPERGVIEQVFEGTPLPSYLPYSIMRAESGFTARITSFAGARGLMQLMPFVGEELHGVLGLTDPYDPERLYVPGYNAWLGASELKRLQERLSEQPVEPLLPLVIGGYNAGPHNIERWMGGQERSEEGDVFAENIGYSETRRYVRKVLGYLMEYRMIYGDDGLQPGTPR